MTNEELNTALYKKVFAELALEEYDLSDKQCKALLKSPCPLADVFAAWEDRETSYMEEIWQTVTDRARTEVQKSRNAQMER